MIYPTRWFPTLVIFCAGILLGGMVLAIVELGPKKLSRQGVGNWEFEVTGPPCQKFLLIRGVNFESARYVSRVNTKVEQDKVIVEVYSSFVHPFVRKKSPLFGRVNPGKIISFERAVSLPSPVFPEYSIYYRDIDGTLHLIQKVQFPKPELGRFEGS